ncbi:hypothetical protein V6N13_000406 [Hibiscus sabdariffa]
MPYLAPVADGGGDTVEVDPDGGEEEELELQVHMRGLEVVVDHGGDGDGEDDQDPSVHTEAAALGVDGVVHVEVAAQSVVEEVQAAVLDDEHGGLVVAEDSPSSCYIN